jgi:hypothetical protein
MRIERKIETWIEAKGEAGTAAAAGGIYCHGCYLL